MKSIFVHFYIIAITVAIHMYSSTRLYARSVTQVLTIDSCYLLARENYPLIKKYGLIDQSKSYALENARKGYLPQISWGAEATYQSAVTSLPFVLPNSPVHSLSKDRYNVYTDIEQSLYSGGKVKNQLAAANAAATTRHQSLEVSLFQLKERVEQLYFGILLFDANLKQNRIHQNELKTGLEQTQAMVMYGTALKSNTAVIQAALLEAKQVAETIKSSRKAYLIMLGLLIHRNLAGPVRLIMPDIPALAVQNHRPELALFDARSDQLDIQKSSLLVRNRPQLNLFVHGGYGRPGLNMLSNQFEGYYLGGIRLSWPLFGLYTTKNEQRQIAIQQKDLRLDKETFIFNTTLKTTQQLEEINNIQALITTDSAIVSLRRQVATTSLAQLKNGVITANDYVQNLLKEHQARQKKIYHQIKLISTIYLQKATLGE